MICYSPISIRSPSGSSNKERYNVPCGKCYACKMNLRMSWTYRLYNELLVSKSAYFITLTYDPRYLPEYGSLNKYDLQGYLKKLRYYGKFRYFAVGEYGERTFRPHFHVLLFNYQGQKEKISYCWEKGFVSIGTVTQASIHYCTKDLMKGLSKKNSKIIDPFRLMSLKPAIGENQTKYLLNKKLSNNFMVSFNGFKISIPRYYKEKIFNLKQKEQHAEEMRLYSDKKFQESLEELKKKGITKPFDYIEKEREALNRIEVQKLKNRKL